MVFITGMLWEEVIEWEAVGEREGRIFDTEEFRTESKASYVCTMGCQVVDRKTPQSWSVLSFH